MYKRNINIIISKSKNHESNFYTIYFVDLIMSDGFTTIEISQKLYISETTVITHRKNIQEKLCAKNACEIICIAFRSDLLK